MSSILDALRQRDAHAAAAARQKGDRRRTGTVRPRLLVELPAQRKVGEVTA